MELITIKKFLKNISVLTSLIMVLLMTLPNISVAHAQDVNAKTEFDFLKGRLPSVLNTDYTSITVPDSFTYEVPWDEGSPAAVLPGAPVISGHNREAFPNETVTFTGWDFTSFSGDKKGSDVTLWIWSGKGTGTLKKMELYEVGHDIVMASIPSDMPIDMYLVWAENSLGISSPVFINRSESQWIGPLGNNAAAGQTKRVFGRSLTSTLKDRADDNTAMSYVYLRSKTNGAVTKCTVNTNVASVDPIIELNQYNVSFEVPSGIANGEYELYTSNGMGGKYGFAKPIDLTVAPAFAFGMYSESLSPSGGNDSTQINAALTRIANQSNGGTLNLAAGTYYLDDQTYILKNTRLSGAGMNSTILVVNDWVNLGPKNTNNDPHNNITIENLTIQTKNIPTQKTEISIRTSYNTYDGVLPSNIKIDRVKFLEGGYGIHSQLYFVGKNIEISNCDFQWKFTSVPTDWWVHDNTFNGIKTVQNESDGAMKFGGNFPNGGDIGRLIVERNYAQTPDWPIGPGGSRNYDAFESPTAFANRFHNTRLMHFSAHSTTMSDSYIARNQTQDVGICDNKGEIILFHSQETPYFFRTSSGTQNTLTINTTAAPGFQIVGIDDSPTPAVTVPDQILYMYTSDGNIDNSAQVVITAGKGKGQVRTIVSHTQTTVTVSEPFKVIPDSTSVFHITCTYTNQVVYSNELNGLPEGFVDFGGIPGHVASVGVDFDGGAMNCAADKNTNRRTFYGDLIQGYVCGAQSFWSVIRDSKSLDGYRMGAVIDAITNASPASSGGIVKVSGTLTLGCFIRNHTADRGILISPETKGTTTSSTVQKIIDGCGVENSKIDNNFSCGEKIGNHLLTYDGSSSAGATKFGAVTVSRYTSAVVRNIILGSNLPAPKIVSAYDSLPMYDNITSESGQTVQFVGNKGDNTPIVNYRNLHFASDINQNPQSQIVDIKNFGETNSTWQVERIEGSFITVQAAMTTFTPTTPIGSLTVSVNSTGLAEGTYKGIIYVKNNSGKYASIGVSYAVGTEEYPDPGSTLMPGINLLKNPSFEDGAVFQGQNFMQRELQNWILTGGTSDTVVMKAEIQSYEDEYANRTAGNFCARTSEPWPPLSATPSYYGLSQTVSAGIYADKTYMLDFIMMKSTVSAGLDVTVTDQNNTELLRFSARGEEDAVHQFNKEFTTLSTTTSLTVKFIGEKDSVEFDIVKLYTLVEKGDISSDGNLDAYDLVMVKQHLLGMRFFTQSEKAIVKWLKDTDNVCVSDLVYMKKLFAGL